MPKLIQSANKDEIPEGAIRIPEEKVVQLYSNLVEEWQPKSDVWALAYGPEGLGVLAAMSGFHVNWYFRRALSLKRVGFFSTYLPNTVFPMLIVNAIHPIVTIHFAHIPIEPIPLSHPLTSSDIKFCCAQFMYTDTD